LKERGGVFIQIIFYVVIGEKRGGGEPVFFWGSERERKGSPAHQGCIRGKGEESISCQEKEKKKGEGQSPLSQRQKGEKPFVACQGIRTRKGGGETHIFLPFAEGETWERKGKGKDYLHCEGREGKKEEDH